MAGFDDKSDDIKNLIQSFVVNPKAFESKDSCATCGNKVSQDDFVNDISRREYTISLMCQTCQDKVFDKPNLN